MAALDTQRIKRCRSTLLWPYKIICSCVGKLPLGVSHMVDQATLFQI
jgi:hypothetical protein